MLMVESAGVYGPWFEWERFGKPQSTREQLLALGDHDLILKDPNLYFQRDGYRKECQRIFQGISLMIYAMEEGIGIQVNDPSLGDGLILRETFEERDPAHRGKFVRTAFLVTKGAVFKIRNLAPRALEKTEKARVDFRLIRLRLVSDKIIFRDIFLDDKPEDGTLLHRVIKQSVETAKKKVGPQEYAANLARLS